MALSDKDIIITPNKSQTADPKIEFRGADSSTGAQTITVKAYPTNGGTLSFEGSSGQLFAVTNSLTGTLFSVNDISGVPSIEVLDTGFVKLAQYGGTVGIGVSTSAYTDKLQIANADSTGIRFTGSNATITSNYNLIGVASNNIYLRPSSAYSVIIDSGTGLYVSSGNITWASGSQNNGNPRSLAIGYSGGNYGQTGYGITFTGTSGLHNYAINDIVSLWEAYDGIRVLAAAAGTVGTAITWTTVLDARRSNSALTFKGNTVLDSNNYSTYASPLAGSASITTVGTIGTGIWQGTIVSPTYGGTGINNGTRTLTINTNAGTIAFSNASTTLTVANNASVSGTNTGDQTNISGNAATATKWQTARTLTLGNVGRVLDGSADLTWTTSELGALSNSTSSTQDGYFGDIYLYDDSTPSHHLRITNSGNLTASNRVLSIDVNDAARTVSLSGNLTVSANATISGTNTGDQTTVSGNAGTATTWQTARTLTIGATGKSVDGSANVSWSASEIGLTSYLPLAGGTLTGALTGTSINTSGNVGIGMGATAPSNRLHIQNTTTQTAINANDNQFLIIENVTNAQCLYGIGFKSQNGFTQAGIFAFSGTNGGANGDLRFYTRNTSSVLQENMRLSDAGVLTVGGNTVLNAGNYNSYSPTLTGTGASGTWGISITGNAATATSADQIDGVPFRNSISSGPVNADNLDSNGITYYTSGVTNFSGNSTDGALYSQAYSSSWQHQIAGDYRSGQIALRGKNSGTWQSWRTVLDSSNYTSYVGNGTLTLNTSGNGISGSTSFTANQSSAGTFTVTSNATVNNTANTIMYRGGSGEVYVGDVYSSNWFRNYGTAGLYNQDHGNHWYATGNDYWNLAGNNASNIGIILRSGGHQGTIRGYVYADSNNHIGFLSNGGSWKLRVVGGDYTLADGSSIRGQLFYDSNDTNYYIDPASTGTSANFAGNIIVANGRTDAYIYMGDTDEGQRVIHNNSNRIGFLNQSSGWGAWCDDSGYWQSDTSIRGPLFYDSNDTGFYCDPASYSNLKNITNVYYAKNGVYNNLGNPSVDEKALFHGQFNNKFRFWAPQTQEESTNGTTWTTSTRATSQQLLDLMLGEGQGTGFTAIPAPGTGNAGYYRLTWDATLSGSPAYCFLDAVYCYNSTSGNNVTFTVEAQDSGTSNWVTIATGTISNWPGHTYIPHSSLPYVSNGTSGYYKKVRLTFAITSAAAYGTGFTLNAIEWWGGYPQGRRNVQYYDSNQNVFWPAKVYGTQFVDQNNSSYYLDPDSSSYLNLIRANNWLYLDQNYGHSIVGTYASTRYQGVFAMGDSYKLPADGTTTGSLYGIAWSHPNTGGVAANLNTHGALVMENGTFLAAISGSIRCRDDMRAPRFYDSGDTNYYVDPASTSILNAVTATEIRSSRYTDSSANFLFGVATGSNVIRSINLADSVGDPATAVNNYGGTGITWGQNSSPYYMIYMGRENYNGDYTKLTLAWHTGIKIGAASSYGGVRFYNNSPFTGTEIFSVGKGDNNVRVENTLYIGGNTAIHAGNYTSYVGNGTLTLNVSGTGLSGSTSFTANQSGNTTFTVTSNATSANTASAIVARDGNGDFQARNITTQDDYTNGWFRNNSNNTGLYNQSTYLHLSSTGANTSYLDISTVGSTNSGIRFYTGGHVNTLRGYIVANTSNELMLWNAGGSYSARFTSTQSEIYQDTYVPTLYANIMYRRGDTGYYLDPAATESGKMKYSFTVSGAGSSAGYGLALYPSYTNANGTSTEPTYGVMFASTSTYGAHGGVAGGDWATYFTINNSDSRGWIFRKAATGNVASINGAGRMRITSLGVNTDPSTTAGEIRATDNITAYYSDERLKTKLGAIENPIEKVKSLSGFYFEANETAVALGYQKKREVGVSAQEVQAILPEIIAPAPIDDKYMTVRYEKLIPLLIEAIKEQQKQIEELKSLLSNNK